MNAVLMIGLQGSGKTTFCNERFGATHVCVSRDRLRNNRRPRRREQQLIRQALEGGRSVAVDNTHPTVADRAPILALAREFRARTIGYCFESSLEPCLERNARREGKARVPDIALFSTFKAFEWPTREEGFDELHFVRLIETGGFEVVPWRDEKPNDET